MISEGGYPTSYKLKAKHVLPFLRLGQRPSSADLSDLQVNGANFNNVEIATCDEEDVLVFEAWDQS